MTHTVSAYTSSSLTQNNKLLEREVTKTHENEARQILIIDRSINYNQFKDELVIASAKASLLNLLQQMEIEKNKLYFPLIDNHALSSWLNGSFAKITLSIKGPKRYSRFLSDIKESGLPLFVRKETDFTVSAFGPCIKSKALHLTKKLQLF